MTPPLILVTDMQSGFLDTSKMTVEMREATHQLVRNVTSLVRWAVSNKHPVAFIEYAGRQQEGEFGHTLPVLLEAVESPIILRKRSPGLLGDDTTNQSYRIESIAQLRASTTDKVRLAGVNTGDCVLETARDLMDASISQDIQILAGQTLRLLNPHVADHFQADNNLMMPLSGRGLWYKEEIMKFMPTYQNTGVNLISKLQNPDMPLAVSSYRPPSR